MTSKTTSKTKTKKPSSRSKGAKTPVPLDDPWAGLGEADSATNADLDEELPFPPDAPCDAPALGNACIDLLKHLDAIGKAPSTINSYAGDLASARRFLGERTLLSDITPELVTAFGRSDLVTRTMTGRAKAKPSIDKTRRVLRLLMDWAVERGWIDLNPCTPQE